MEKKKKVIVYDVQDEVRGMQAMSLVYEPAIKSDFVYLSEEQRLTLSKFDEERGIIYGAALIPNMLILRIDKKTQEEYYITFTPKCVMQCAHMWLKKNLQSNFTVDHKREVTGVTTVESWIKESDQDKSVMLGLDVPVGTWCIGDLIENEEVKADIKAGKYKGHSIEGYFVPSETKFEDISDEDMLIAELEELLKSL